MIEPYTIAVPDKRLTAIGGKVADYDWNQLPDSGGWRSGVGEVDLRRLADYWLHDYDWRATERRLNRFPHFIVDIEGERLCRHAPPPWLPMQRKAVVVARPVEAISPHCASGAFAENLHRSSPKATTRHDRRESLLPYFQPRTDSAIV
jgi:hypothetical protein